MCPYYYDLNYAFTSSGSAGTEVTQLWGKTVANQETVSIVGIYLASRFGANLLKTAGFALLALLSLIVFRTGDTRKCLVRACRSCGYLCQILRSSLGNR